MQISIALLVSVSVSGVSAVAHADYQVTPEKARVYAKANFVAATEAVAVEDFDRAIAYFKESYNWIPKPEVALSIAKLLWYRSDSPYEARMWLRRYTCNGAAFGKQGAQKPPAFKNKWSCVGERSPYTPDVQKLAIRILDAIDEDENALGVTFECFQTRRICFSFVRRL